VIIAEKTSKAEGFWPTSLVVNTALSRGGPEVPRPSSHSGFRDPGKMPMLGRTLASSGTGGQAFSEDLGIKMENVLNLVHACGPRQEC